MSIDPPEFVRSLQNNIRSRPIPWEGAVRAKTISEAHLKKIKAVDKVRKDARKLILESQTADYVSLFLGRQDEPGILQTAAKRQDIVLYLLVLLEDLIQGMAMPRSRAVLKRRRVSCIPGCISQIPRSLRTLHTVPEAVQRRRRRPATHRSSGPHQSAVPRRCRQLEILGNTRFCYN
jgi:hypothetical protein